MAAAVRMTCATSKKSTTRWRLRRQPRRQQQPAAANRIRVRRPKNSQAPPMERRTRPAKTERFEPEPPPPDPSKKAKKGQQLKEPAQRLDPDAVLLNRDGQPYKRGGPYRPRKGNAKKLQLQLLALRSQFQLDSVLAR
eukprot:6197725-Pleurochrysis_carterae.AAC.1